MKLKNNNTKKNQNKETILLDDLVNNFINWYIEKMVTKNYSKAYEYFEPKRMRNTIEKMASWYELRYSNEDINKIINPKRKRKMSTNDIMFKYNPYIKESFDSGSNIECLDWNELFNYTSFLRELSWEEKWFLVQNNYPDIIYLIKNTSFRNAHFHLDYNGTIIIADDMETIVTKYDKVLHSDLFAGKNIKTAYEMLKEYECKIDYSEIETAIKNYEKREYLKEEFLNCVMYRIIERGGNRIGPKRGLLFAKEFGRNIDIPMKYGIDTFDPDLRYFINEYLKAGGHNDLECYLGYFYRTDDNTNLGTVTLKDVLAHTDYTDEENHLHGKLANYLNKELNNKVRKLVK